MTIITVPAHRQTPEPLLQAWIILADKQTFPVDVVLLDQLGQLLRFVRVVERCSTHDLISYSGQYVSNVQGYVIGPLRTFAGPGNCPSWLYT